jgi:hypothetical protein
VIVRGNIGGGDLRGYGSYGIVGCTTLDTALQNLTNTLAAADQAGVSSDDPDYAAASSFVASPPGVDIGIVWSSDTCTSDTAQANTLYANLIAKVKAAGGTAPTPVQASTGSGGGLLDSLNPFSGSGSGGMSGWIIGIIVVAGVIGTAWLASSGAKIYMAAKKAKAATT